MQNPCFCWTRAEDSVSVELKGKGPVRSESLEVGEGIREIEFGVSNLSGSSTVRYTVYWDQYNAEVESGIIRPDRELGMKYVNHLVPTLGPGSYSVELKCLGPDACYAQAVLQMPRPMPFDFWKWIGMD